MRLVSISIDRFRSITTAYKIRLGDSTVLVGPNNEGKSNVLRALVAGMNILIRERGLSAGMARTHRGGRPYDWERDYPIGLQKKQPGGTSKIVLEFELTGDEITDFRREVKSALNGTLPLRIEIGRLLHSITVLKRGPGGAALTKKSARIAAFVADRLQFEHIPAVRTASSAQQIVEELVANELGAVETDPEYAAALAKIQQIQQPILDKLSVSIQGTLVTFLPDVTDVRVTIPQAERHRALRGSCEIIVDDGTPTSLKMKGDGVQSLAALAIMRHATEGAASGRNLVIAIEEPESHLHPHAIHELRAVLDEMSEKHQIVLTTHNPLFIDRLRISSNVLVYQNKARPAANVEEIREILGVRSSDNLRNAELVLVVEGEEDRTALSALLQTSSATLAEAISSGAMAIDTLAGGTNLAYKLGLLRNSLSLYHVFLDDDKTGRESFDKARLQGLIADADVNFATCPGLDEAELEDLYDPALYESFLLNTFRVSITGSAFGGRHKWTDRMRDVFKQNGKQWDARVEADVKRAVAKLAAANPGSALHSARRLAFDSLATTIQARLQAIQDARD